MKRFVPVLVLAGVGGVLIAAGGTTSPPGAALPAIAEEKGPGISDFMLVVHDRQGILPQVRQALSGAGPADEKAWKAVRARAEILVTLSESILLRKLPDKGDKASWREKVGAYISSARALASASGSMNAAAARTEAGKLQKSCNACHKAHQ